MSMFTNYDNIAPNTPNPDNRFCKQLPNKIIESSDIFKEKEPTIIKNILDKPIYMQWRYGDSVTIPYEVSNTFIVEKDAIIYTAEGEKPSAGTKAYQGQTAYNTYDLTKYICTSENNSGYIWEETTWKTFSKEQVSCEEKEQYKIIIVSDEAAEKYMQNKTVVFKLYNFRFEKIFETYEENSAKFNIVIDTELSNKLVPGNYFCTFSLIDENDTYLRSFYKINITDFKDGECYATDRCE